MTSKITKKNYTSKAPDQVKFSTGKGKVSGGELERWISIENLDGSRQRIVITNEDWQRIFTHFSVHTI